MNEKVRMRDLPLSCTPYERFKKVGVSNLSDSELFAILLRTGTKRKSVLEISENLLSNFSYEDMSNADYNELKSIEGIGEIKAIEIKCVFEIASRIEKMRKKNAILFSNPDLIADYARTNLRLKDYEILKVLYLNNKLKLIHEEDFSGGIDMVSVPSRKIYKNAILYNASNVVLVHNHPSGDISPSEEDIKTTEKLYDALKKLDVKLVDHIIVSENDYFSFRKNKYFDFEDM